MITRQAKLIMKNKPNVTDLAGEKVMVDFKYGKYFMLKGVGNDIWEMLEDEITVNDIIERLLSEYEVEEAECENTTIKFLEQLEELEFIEGIV